MAVFSGTELPQCPRSRMAILRPRSGRHAVLAAQPNQSEERAATPESVDVRNTRYAGQWN